MTASNFPDVPDLLATMRACDGVDEPRTPNTLATIRELARRQSPAQQQAAREYVDRVELGLDALALGTTYVEKGDLDAAARWFRVAVRYDADGAREELEAVLQLQAALAEPGVPDDSVLGPAPLEQHPHDDAAARGISTYTLDWADQEAERITAEARDEAAAIVRNAESSAAALVLDAEASAARIREEAQRDAEAIRAGARDEMQDEIVYTSPECVATKWTFTSGEPVDGLWTFRPTKPALGLRWFYETDVVVTQRLGRALRSGGTVHLSPPEAEAQERLTKLPKACLLRPEATTGRVESLVQRWFARTRPREDDVTQGPQLFLPTLRVAVDHCERLPVAWDGMQCEREIDAAALGATWRTAIFLISSGHLASEQPLRADLDHGAGFTVVDASSSGLGPRLLVEAKGFVSPSAVPVFRVADDDESIVITDLSAS